MANLLFSYNNRESYYGSCTARFSHSGQILGILADVSIYETGLGRFRPVIFY